MGLDVVAFFDIEVNTTSKEIESLGVAVGEDELVSSSIAETKHFFDGAVVEFICGHNFIDHDKKYLSSTSFNPIFSYMPIIDTLMLSMLLFPNKRTHKLDKPYKTELNIENQPLGDARQTRELLILLDKKFDSLSFELQSIFAYLLYDSDYFNGYFRYKKIDKQEIDIYNIIKNSVLCDEIYFKSIIKKRPVELAFVLSFIFSDKEASISYVLLNKFPKIVGILKFMSYSSADVDLEAFAYNEFKISSFRDFEPQDDDGLFAKRISQRDIVESTLKDKSILAILPTGGGKTFTFQLPALIKARAYKGLSVVISPLQALMKNHVDSFREKNQNFKVLAISGYLSPIERMNAIAEVENGVVDILYLAPEALRSNSIFKALKRRIIDRFIIDEAHCFSSWGHDFRHDYHYIATTIKELEATSPFQSKIAVSCFTATAKPEVLNDIKKYFQDKLDIELIEFLASTKRDNLGYKAIEVGSQKDKYDVLVKEILRLGKVPTIIYIPQSAKECRDISTKLNEDIRLGELGIIVEPFYAKIDEEIERGKREGRDKSKILNDFIDNNIDIVVATTAFGMGIDKPDITAVIHYGQSDSIESYLQESGRGARGEGTYAECIVLYTKDDFNKMFTNLNRSKIDYHEIARAVNELKYYKKDILYLSPKQLAQKMGIDTEDSKIDYEVIIKTALLELEHANIIKQGRNKIEIFATSVDKEKRSMSYIHSVLDDKKDEYDKIYNYMIDVMQNIIQKSKVDAIEVDDLADIMGIEKHTIFEVLYALQKEGLLEFNNDVTIFIKKSVLEEFEKHFELEQNIFNYFMQLESYVEHIDLREINEKLSDETSTKDIKKIIQSWTHLSKIGSNVFNASFRKDICYFSFDNEKLQTLKKLINSRRKSCDFILLYVLGLLDNKDEDEVEISTNLLKFKLEQIRKISIEGFHHSIVYLHDTLKGFQLRKGRLIYYKTLKLTTDENIRLNTPYRKRDHYNKSLKPYYERKIEAIHIQIAFIKRLLKDGWDKTIVFVLDYFTLEYSRFKKKYGFDDNEIKLPITKERLEEIIYDLNGEQRAIFDDKTSKSIMVLAGPGSGKTKTLVHKIASLITIENNKPEYFLMLAHSRVAVAEFKERLYKLIGNQAYDVKIYTFHAFALELMGSKVTKESKLESVIDRATLMIENSKIELPHIQMLVLDEYQDVGEKLYKFIKVIFEKMSKDRRIIAVGDDDQCINNFGDDRADIVYISQFQKDFTKIDDDEEELENQKDFSQYSLLTNYRSRKKIVELANSFRLLLPNRIKNENLIPFIKKDANITMTLYEDGSYIENITKSILYDESENIAVLARTNDEVLAIYSNLILSGINAKYIISKDGFRLGNLIELRDFLYFWKSTSFKDALERFEKIYNKSKNYNLANDVIGRFSQEFEIENNELYYQVFFEEYLSDIEFDEFVDSRARVVVSTMHKSKGKEFDSVYLAIQEQFINNSYDARLLYVALTRAKKSLHIHSKDQLFIQFSSFMDNIYRYDKKEKEPYMIVFEMGLGDIMLSNNFAQKNISYVKPMAGESVDIVQKDEKIFELMKNNRTIARLSGSDFQKTDRLSSKIIYFMERGYCLNEKAEIEYMVEWLNKENGEKYIEVLAKIFMSRSELSLL